MANDDATPAVRPADTIALVSTLLAILYIVFTIRYLVLKRLRASGAPRIRLPDFTLGLALALFTVQVAFVIWTAKTREYFDRSPADDDEVIITLGLPESEAVLLQKLVVAANFLYLTALYLIKASFVLYYYDFHTYLSKRLQVCLFGVTATVAIAYAANMIITASWCSPVSRTWSFDSSNFCTPINSQTLIAFTAWTSITIDFMLIIFPLFILRTLQLRGLQQCAVGVLPSMTFLTSVTSIVRFGVLIHLRVPHLSFHFTQRWQIACIVEIFIGIFAACHPALRALVRRAWRVNYGSVRSGSSGSRGTRRRMWPGVHHGISGAKTASSSGSTNSRKNLLPMQFSDPDIDAERLVETDKNEKVLVTEEELARFRYA